MNPEQLWTGVLMAVTPFLLFGLGGCYNIDTTSPLIFTDHHADSRFGQALTLHQHGSETMLVVGAPKGQCNYTDIVRGGVAYKCSFTNHNASLAGNCTELQLDNRGNDYSGLTGRQIYNKSDQWLGASMSSGGPNGSLVICRPRYRYYFYKSYGAQQQQRDLLGGCFVLTQENFDTPNILLPCITGGDRRCQNHNTGGASDTSVCQMKF
eukprot:XP_011661026.1 PREDICTED: integrin alpha-4-like [Strongylocentrotus purpuratus]